ncbi:hypothetical protein IT411_02760 [Candidatus Peregrinibacteria bacterium]|nr:hypothetical protein [Candidatus Peregrinibacteria bacterium]
MAISVLRTFNGYMLAKKITERFEEVNKAELPDNVEKYAPYIEVLEEALLTLARQYKLDLDSRMKLRQALLDWLATKLQSPSKYPLELAKMGFQIHGERIIHDLEPKTVRVDEKETLREALEIMDDTSGKISKL